MGYKIALDIYNGPLDLLLHLIRREEVDIYDIPIAKITEQYLAYLDVLKVLDINLAGDFIVMAATLMEIKARMLLPRPEVEEEEEEDPRSELVKQLMEYKRFKDAGRALGEYAQERAMRFARVGEEWPEEKKDDDALKEVGLWDLVDAFAAILKQTTLRVSTEIVYDDTPVEVYRAEILERLRDKPMLSFSELFRGALDRSRVLGVFLALLELIRLRKVRAEQSSSFGEIQILLRDDSDIEPEAEPSAADAQEGELPEAESDDDQEVELDLTPAEVAMPHDKTDDVRPLDASAEMVTNVKAEVEAEFAEFIGNDDEAAVASAGAGSTVGDHSDDNGGPQVGAAGPSQEEQDGIEQAERTQSDAEGPPTGEDKTGSDAAKEQAQEALGESAAAGAGPTDADLPEGFFQNLWRRGKTLVAGLLKRDGKDW